MATKKNSEVASPKSGGAVAPYDYGKHAGGGYEGSSSADFQVPFLLLLQKESPQVEDSGSGKEIKGAKPGMFFLTSTNDLFGGEEGVVLVPCYSEHVFNEWVPRKMGGGFRGTFRPESPEVQKARAEAHGSLFLTRGDNELTETFNLYCMILRAPGDEVPIGVALFSITTKKIKWYKAMRSRIRAAFGEQVPLYAVQLRMKSWQDKNDKGNFKNIKFEAAVDDDLTKSLLPPDSPLVEAGYKLKESILKGEAKVDYSQGDGSVGEGDGDGAGVF